MDNNKIVSLQKYKNSKKLEKLFCFKKSQEIKKMFFVVIIVGAVLGLLAWDTFVENPARIDVKIPESKNITYNSQEPISMTTNQVANEFEKYDGKPILLYIYTTWCPVCSKQMPIINEVAREFQNTDLHVLTLAIDRDLEAPYLQSYLNKFGDLYFAPHYLAFKGGFLELLRKKNINYQGRIPFTVLISSDGTVITKYVGAKSQNYLRNKVIKELF